MPRVVVALACSVCRRRNHTTLKKKKEGGQKLALRRYCRWCRKHTLHNETKVE